jgi:hypothetical protein
MLFDLAMAATPVTASPGHQHQYCLAEDRLYHVQAKMVGRLLRGAGKAVKGDLLHVGRRGRTKFASPEA